MSRKLKLALAGLIFLTSASITLAGETGGGAHGGSLVYLNGVPELADPFVVAPGEMMDLSPEMKKYLESIQMLLERYTITSHRYFNELVLGRVSEYRYVTDQLPCKDKVKLSDPTMESEEYGCTNTDGVTYILQPEFAKLSFTKQALALMHERVHAFYKGDQEHWVAGFITGVQRLLELRKIQASGKPVVLTDDESKELQTLLFKRAEQLGFAVGIANADGETWDAKIWNNGGGLVSNTASMDAESVISIGSRVGEKAIFFRSNLTDSIVGRKAVLSNSPLVNSELGAGTVVNDSIIKDSQVLSGKDLTGEIGSTIKGSNLENCTVTESEVINSECKNASIVKARSFKQSRIFGVKMQSEVKLESVSDSVIADSSITAPWGVNWGTTRPSIKMKNGLVEDFEIKGAIINQCNLMSASMEKGSTCEDSYLTNTVLFGAVRAKSCQIVNAVLYERSNCEEAKLFDGMVGTAATIEKSDLAQIMAGPDSLTSGVQLFSQGEHPSLYAGYVWIPDGTHLLNLKIEKNVDPFFFEKDRTYDFQGAKCKSTKFSSKTLGIFGDGLTVKSVDSFLKNHCVR